MSPEQAEGRLVDHRSDIFSLGTILYEMATGVRPFTGETALAVLSAIVKDTPRSVTEVNSTAPREFARVVKRCLAKEVARRYQTAVDLRNELEELRTELDSGATSPTAAAQTQSGSGSAVGGAATSAAIRVGLTKPITIASIGLAVVVVAGAVALPAFRPDLWHQHAAPSAATTYRQITFVGNATFPTISRDGKFLAYVTTTPVNHHQALNVQEISGGQPLQIFEGEGLGPPPGPTRVRVAHQQQPTRIERTLPCASSGRTSPQSYGSGIRTELVTRRHSVCRHLNPETDCSCG